MKTAEESSGTVKAPFVVVSDVHLGGKDSNDDDFRDFLQWLTSLPDAEKTFS